MNALRTPDERFDGLPGYAFLQEDQGEELVAVVAGFVTATSGEVRS
ncbi:MAG: hypothetical protein ACXW2C_09435 [Acidimicrobiia bacterium]